MGFLFVFILHRLGQNKYLVFLLQFCKLILILRFLKFEKSNSSHWYHLPQQAIYAYVSTQTTSYRFKYTFKNPLMYRRSLLSLHHESLKKMKKFPLNKLYSTESLTPFHYLSLHLMYIYFRVPSLWQHWAIGFKHINQLENVGIISLHKHCLQRRK